MIRARRVNARIGQDVWMDSISKTFSTRSSLLLAFVAVWILTAGAAFGEEAGRPSSGIFFSFDNDFINGTDRGYTGGLGFGWFSRDLNVREGGKWKKFMPFARGRQYSRHISLSFDLRAYTPDDISISEIIQDDRPYAGYFSLSIGFHSIGRDILHLVEFNTGIVGPSSGGEKMQRFVHKKLENVEPMGWKNQLKDEILFQIYYSIRARAFRTGSSKGLGMELIQKADLGAGNVYTCAGFGFLARAGWNIPLDFGSSPSRPAGGCEPGLWHTKGFGFNIFASANVQTVLRNIFLDGNTFKDSHRVDKYMFTGDASVGLSIQVWSFTIRYEQVYWTKKFKTESGPHSFAKLMLAVRL